MLTQLPHYSSQHPDCRFSLLRSRSLRHHLLHTCRYMLALIVGVSSSARPKALRLASEELVWFREQGQKRGQATQLP